MLHPDKSGFAMTDGNWVSVRSETKDEKQKTREGRSKRQDPETSLPAGQAGSG